MLRFSRHCLSPASPVFVPHRSFVSPGSKLFKRILIANRGEIVRRIVRTCKRLGIETVAIYTDVDAESLHVRTADRAIPLGSDPRAYLDIEAVVRAVQTAGADAVHPGYGFLSENPRFVRRLEELGVAFVGPTSASISALGDKISAKLLAQKNGVSTVPGVAKDVTSLEELRTLARQVGYPVMIKAASGGGGKGMRMARSDAELEEGFRLSKQEAKNAFADDRVLLERYVEHPRHIEIQVMGDGRGGAVYFPERECSIQRRNQKVVEEAPSPHLDADTRRRMGEQAVRLATAVRYRTAGTCEFLVDAQRNFFFLEMNTRLQVEHPITEMVTGLDLVELMIRIAAGEPLPLQQHDVPLRGWAMEARVYAEDPLRGFLPSIGQLTTFREPPLENGLVRVDTGVAEGSTISTYYDPLIAKLACWGTTRDEALARTARALDSFAVGGLAHNINFLRDVMCNPRYRAGQLSTYFIPEEYPTGFHGHQLTEQERDELLATAAAVTLESERQRAELEGQLAPPAPPAAARLHLRVQNRATRVDAALVRPGVLQLVLEHPDQPPRRCTLAYRWQPGAPHFHGELQPAPAGAASPQTAAGPAAQFVVQPHGRLHGGIRLLLQHVGTQYAVEVLSPEQHAVSRFMPEEAKTDVSNSVLSPMAGKVVSVAVQAGQAVFAGQELAIVEAMKMQNVLKAPRDGTVQRVPVQAGQDVLLDQLLVEFKPVAAPGAAAGPPSA